MKTVSKAAAKNMLKLGEIEETLFDAGYTILMPKAKAEKWIDALRNGDFIQAEGALHDTNTGGFCCLGVEQYVNNNEFVEVDKKGEFECLPTIPYLNERGYLFVSRNNNLTDNPYIASVYNDVADLNDKVEYRMAVKVNQHRIDYKDVHKNNFKTMARLLERAMLVY